MVVVGSLTLKSYHMYHTHTQLVFNYCRVTYLRAPDQSHFHSFIIL
ncbi:hypothetical protein KSS87_014674, partial [Heliosperma pusillum]